MKLLTHEEYLRLGESDEYYRGRWKYFKEVIEVIKKIEPSNVLELGPYRAPFVSGSDIMDCDNHLKGIKYPQDAGIVPWPIQDKQYDLFIALQVWEHLDGRQKQAFREVMRISKYAILSFPYKWTKSKYKNHNKINNAIIKDWTLGVKPIKKISVPFQKVGKLKKILNRIFNTHPFGRMIYVFKFK
ncbi:hypothetical protein GOV14_06405 [Candidatus Pacearchaeota archaeon]|nr:hypothetical protein [Candidatus Pacearchaeota archaeon]